MQRSALLQRRCLAQVPEQLVQLPHDQEYREHLPGQRGRPPPVLPAVGDLDDLLAGAEAVIDGAAGEAALPELIMNAAAEVPLQMRARLAGRLSMAKSADAVKAGAVQHSPAHRAQSARRSTASFRLSRPAGGA